MKKRFAGLMAALVLVSLASTAHAVQRRFTFIMDGASENPANASPGTGVGSAIYDDVAGTLALTASYGTNVPGGGPALQGTVTQTHFHATSTNGLAASPFNAAQRKAAAAAVTNVGIAVGNTSLPNFTLGATSGTYSQTLNLNDSTIYGIPFLTANGNNVATARATFVTALLSGRTYWNIHTSSFGGGEIRGFPIPVPEPASLGLAAMGLTLVAAARRRQ